MGTEISLEEYRKKRNMKTKKRKKNLFQVKKGWISLFFIIIIYFLFFHPNAYKIMYQGQEMGVYKKDEKLIEKMFETARVSKIQELQVEDLRSKQSYILKKVHVRKSKWINSDIIILNMKNAMEVEVKAVIIKVNGLDKIIVGNKEEAQKILKEVKEPFTKKYNTSLENLVFEESVEVVEDYMDAKEIMEEEEIKKILREKTISEDTYKIQNGDSFSSIENKFGMQYGELQQLNPQLNPLKIKQGEEVKIKIYKPFLTVLKK